MAQIKCRNIGTSKGFIIPEKVLYSLHIDVNDVIELTIKDKKLILEKTSVRSNWNEAFKIMSKNKDDELLITDIFEGEDETI